jgi:dTDP-4-dehydrorhamnose reductase
MKILILGHNGLLGNMVYSYFNQRNYEIFITDFKWPNEDFKTFVSEHKVDYIINCIGMIPQKKPSVELYNLINYELPMWLDSLGVRIIHPDTDEPSDTPYGLSKELARKSVSDNTKIIKSSIMGFEKEGYYSFLEWFLNSEGSVNGFVNQYWNGNTTLEWSKWSEKIIKNWNSYKHVTILENPQCLSKYEILKKIKQIFNKEIEIIPTESSIPKNNCMKGDYMTQNLVIQLKEMKNFHSK